MCYFNKKEYNYRFNFKKCNLKKIVYKSLLANFYFNKTFKIY